MLASEFPRSDPDCTYKSISTRYNVYSALGGVQCTVRRYHQYIEGDHQCIEGDHQCIEGDHQCIEGDHQCIEVDIISALRGISSVHWGGYHQCIEGDIINAWGLFSQSRDIIGALAGGEYHQYIERMSWSVCVGGDIISAWGRFTPILISPNELNTLMISSNPLNTLMISSNALNTPIEKKTCSTWWFAPYHHLGACKTWMDKSNPKEISSSGGCLVFTPKGTTIFSKLLVPRKLPQRFFYCSSCFLIG